MEAGVNPSAPSRSRSRRMMVLDGCFALSRSGTRERDMRLRKKETEISSASTASKAARAGGGAGRSSGQLVAVEVSTSRPIKQQQRQEQQRERQRTISSSSSFDATQLVKPDTAAPAAPPARSVKPISFSSSSSSPYSSDSDVELILPSVKTVVQDPQKKVHERIKAARLTEKNREVAHSTGQAEDAQGRSGGEGGDGRHPSPPTPKSAVVALTPLVREREDEDRSEKQPEAPASRLASGSATSEASPPAAVATPTAASTSSASTEAPSQVVAGPVEIFTEASAETDDVAVGMQDEMEACTKAASAPRSASEHEEADLEPAPKHGFSYSTSPELEEIPLPTPRRKRKRASSTPPPSAPRPIRSATDSPDDQPSPRIVQRIRRRRIQSTPSSSSDEDAPLRSKAKSKSKSKSKSTKDLHDTEGSLADSQEPPTLRSGSSSSASPSTSAGASDLDIRLVDFRAEDENDTSDDALYKDRNARNVARELAAVKRECKPFFPSSSLTPLSSNKKKPSSSPQKALVISKSKRERRRADEEEEEESAVGGRYTAKQKGKRREVMRVPSDSESDYHQQDRSRGRAPSRRQAALSDAEDDDEDRYTETDDSRPLRRQRQESKYTHSTSRSKGTRPGRQRSRSPAPPRIRLKVLPPIRYSILADEDGAVSIGGTSKAPRSRAPIPPLAEDEEAAPASYTRSRTANGSQVQCHRCEAYHPTRQSFKCSTCAGGVCQRCLIEHYSDQGTYIAILGYLLGQLSRDLQDAKGRLKRRESGGSAEETPKVQERPAEEDRADERADAEMDEHDARVDQLKKTFILPPNLDLSSLDFQCPACKFICQCANCLRGPYPIGHPLHRASLVAAASGTSSAGPARQHRLALPPPRRPAVASRARAASSLRRSYSTEDTSYGTPDLPDGPVFEHQQDDDAEEDAFEVSSRPYGRACLAPITVDDELYHHPHLSAGSRPSKPLLSRRTAGPNNRSPPDITYVSSHADEAAAQARAIRASLDADMDFAEPVVVASSRAAGARRQSGGAVVNSRRIPNNKGNNAVPRFGSPPRNGWMRNDGQVVDDDSHLLLGGETEHVVVEQSRRKEPVRRSQRVRLATKVGQQLGKAPAKGATETALHEPIFTLSESTTPDMAASAVPDATDELLRPFDPSAESTIDDDGLFGPAPAPSQSRTPVIEITLDERRLLSTFTSLAPGSSDEADMDLDIPDFSSFSASAVDGPSPADTLATTASSISVRSPSLAGTRGRAYSPPKGGIYDTAFSAVTAAQQEKRNRSPFVVGSGPLDYGSTPSKWLTGLEEPADWALAMHDPIF